MACLTSVGAWAGGGPTRRYGLVAMGDGKPVVRLAAGRRDLLMQVDTGAETSVLTAAGAALLGLRPGAPWRRIAGLGGLAAYPTVWVTGLGFAGMACRDLRLPVMRLPLAAGVDGIIGIDLLRDFVVGLDLAAGAMTLTDALPTGVGHAALRFVPGAGLPVVTARVGQRLIPALLDTGAGGSAIDVAVSGMMAGALAEDPARLGYGAGGMAVPARLHRFDDISLGGRWLGTLTLRVTRLPAVLPMRLVLGIDVLRGRVLWIDYPGRRLALG